MLGDSFCKALTILMEITKLACTFNPHAWGLFLQEEAWRSGRSGGRRLSIPMLGDSFCKPLRRQDQGRERFRAFNPHAWGLFLQAPMNMYAVEGFIRTFNPHAWGLFLQATHVDVGLVRVIAHFQSPCLGTLFASIIPF